MSHNQHLASQSYTASKREILTVSKLNRLARSILEAEIGVVWLSAEISNFVAASSGHWYFTLKDAKAQVRAAMFRNANRRVTMKVKAGDNVLVRANIGLYEPRGDYQIIVEHLEAEGTGALKQQFEQLKVKLTAEGLFDRKYKQALPQSPAAIGVITSTSGAALYDILHVLKRRNPTTNIVVYPSQVQGEPATQQLCNAIEMANKRNEVDVIILGRGGGSLEDLWCFNEETLARAIYASTIPIVSAVGHEVDVSISDFVADHRAPTPSAAAEILSVDRSEIEQQLAALVSRLAQNTALRCSQANHQLQKMRLVLQQQHPKYALQQQQQHIDRIQASLYEQITNILKRQTEKQTTLQQQFYALQPTHKLALKKRQLTELLSRLHSALENTMSTQRQRFSNNCQMLHAVSPLATLSRGYSITYKGEQIITHSSDLHSGDKIHTKFVDGLVNSVVE